MRRTGFLKRAVFILALPLFAAIAALSGYRVQAAGTEIVSDTDLTQWRAEGCVASEGENGKGIVIRPDGGAFALGFVKDIPASGFMTDFDVDLEKIDFENSVPKVVLAFYDGRDFSNVIYKLTLRLRPDTFDAEVSVGELSHALTGNLYGENGKVQLRLAKEDVENFETAQKSSVWNFVAGSSKETNKNANKFRQERFSAIDAALEAFANSNVCLRFESETPLTLTVHQVLYDCFYRYSIFDAARAGTIGYSTAELTWTLPDISEFSRSAFIVERRRAVTASVEKLYVFNNAYAASLADTDLKQGTAYSYAISAVSQVDGITNKVACSNIAFKYREVSITTEKGSPTLFLIILFSSLIVVAGIVCFYIFYYDIKKKTQKRKEK